MLARRAAKPACISAAIERAMARASASAGHRAACGHSSARYSMIASESQTTRSPCTSTGTLPAGEWASRAAREPGSDRRTSSVSKSMPLWLAASQPRSDQDE